MKPVTILEITEARKRFSTTVALNGLSLAVGTREWVALLGPNGAGKSTLMGAIAGLLELDSGRIAIAPSDSDPTPSFWRPGARVPTPQIGYIPQEIALYPLLTTAENLRAFGRLQGVAGKRLKRQVDWALEWTGLRQRSNTLAGELSGGMQRRLNIACGVLHQPHLVLLDEPTVGVDPQGRQRIWEMLEQLRDDGASLVHSTHELHEIETVCDRVLILDHGQILAEGTVAELIRQTIGSQARLELTLDRSASGLLSSNGLQVTGDRLSGTVSDVDADLPRVFGKVRAAGLSVRDVRVESPSLEAVFTHLTGRELRE